MGAVTYVDDEKSFRTYRFSTIENHGCSKPLLEALQYAYQKINYNLKMTSNNGKDKLGVMMAQKVH